MKKHIKGLILTVGGFFSQFINRKVIGLMQKYSMLARDKNQVYIFFLAYIERVNSIEISSKLSLTYGDNVNH